MNQNIANIQEKILQGKGITKEEVLSCQNSIESEEDLFYVYWIMSRYYLDRNKEDAMTYCVLKCYELNEKNHFDLPFKVKDFMDARSSFMEEAIEKTRIRLLPLSLLFGVLVLVLFWLIIGNGNFDAFIVGFILMNLISIFFQTYGSKKTLASFKKKQYAAVYEFIDEDDKVFADGH